MNKRCPDCGQYTCACFLSSALENSAKGNVKDLGDFTQYATEPDNSTPQGPELEEPDNIHDPIGRAEIL